MQHKSEDESNTVRIGKGGNEILREFNVGNMCLLDVAGH